MYKCKTVIPLYQLCAPVSLVLNWIVLSCSSEHQWRTWLASEWRSFYTQRTNNNLKYQKETALNFWMSQIGTSRFACKCTILLSSIRALYPLVLFVIKRLGTIDGFKKGCTFLTENAKLRHFNYQEWKKSSQNFESYLQLFSLFPQQHFGNRQLCK